MKTKNDGLACVRGFLKEHRAILILVLFLLAQRILAMYILGWNYSLQSDDVSYIKSGIIFKHTGMIAMHEEVPSAQIMPGLTVFIAAVSAVFGEGNLLWLVLKLMWAFMGSISAWFIYKAVCVFAPKWCGILAAAALARTDYVWMDNTILTETPYVLFLTAMIYFTFMMGKSREWKYFWGCLVTYMLALMLKANVAPYPVFALVYLLIVKYDFKTLLKQGVILGCAVLCFVIPWSIRNYIHFDAFIPLTYGAGNPMLLGTYQGAGFPADDALDYETNVDAVTREKYAKYYDENGEVKEEFVRYVSLGADKIKADYRISEWKKADMPSFLYSYLIKKPVDMAKSVFFWTSELDVSWLTLFQLQAVALRLGILAVISSLVLKKNRPQILFLTIFYLFNLYVFAMTFAFDRYHASMMPIVYIMIGIGWSLLVDMGVRAVTDVKTFDKGQA